MVLALGFVGALVTAVFALYSAPDLALTQLVIELLMVVLLVLGISKMLKVFNVSASRRVLALQLTFSAAFGTMVTFLLLTVLALLLLGGATVQGFLLVILVGVIAGTYSSIGVAAQLLVAFEERDLPRLWAWLRGRGSEQAAA